eukprot:CAMPEP_0201638250 /NCGR_PEP_ID=MMETSP0493-20130528/16102_1 /ASSEMBLY_ACC=CAM_ASM_000838 /TAXON_ID=420259 /ORGANISM="Thalassiosira gravida, Strain GMp14c1" /LENGTH=459 /DNA_ID=CAMNT_0048111219 /DNA_START=10 /DNA_END=1389 /DNA_ORIENTATION=-
MSTMDNTPTNKEGDESLLPPPQEESPVGGQQQHSNPNSLQQHQGVGGGQEMPQQQQAFIGFGIDPNWGSGFGQMMHGHPGYHHSGMQPGAALDGGGIGSQQHIPGFSSPSSMMDPLEPLLGPFPCVRVRGLPYEATLEDVLVFFQGLVVIDVVVLVSSREESVVVGGEAFVVFANPMDFQMGLQRDHQSMGNHYLEIFQGKRTDYYAAIASQHHLWHNTGGGLLDNNNGLIEGQQTGGNKTPVPGGNNIILGTEDSPLELGYGFNNEGDDAWRQKSVGGLSSSSAHSNQKGRGGGGGPGNIINNNHGGLVPTSSNRGGRGGSGKYPNRVGAAHGGRGSKGNYRGGGGGANHHHHHHGGGTRDGPHTGYVRMRGLPYQATKQDVLDFFKEYKPDESSILLTYRVDGRSTGEGYVMFADPLDAKEAMTMHRSTIGSRYIELFISNKEEHTRNVARSTPPLR